MKMSNLMNRTRYRLLLHFLKNGFNGQGIHLRSDFTEHLSSHLSLTRSDNFLNIDLKAVVETRYAVAPDGRQEFLGADYAYYEIEVNAPVYTLREDVSYTLTPTLQLESGFLYNFSPAASSEKGWVDENLADQDLSYTTETPDGEVVREDTFEEVHDEFGHDFYRTEGYVQRTLRSTFVSVDCTRRAIGLSKCD